MMAGEFALIVAALFTGAAFYINFAEQPARLQLDNGAMLVQWKAAYKRGFAMQATLAVIGFLLGLIAAWQTGRVAFVVGSCFMLANWPWTVFRMFPTNADLMDTSPGAAGHGDSAQLFVERISLHAVRTALGGLGDRRLCFGASRRLTASSRRRRVHCRERRGRGLEAQE